MDCREAIELVGRWASGELNAGEQAALDEHLAGCGECRQAAESQQLTDAELLRAFAPRRRAAARLADCVTAELRREPRRAQRRFATSGALAAAAAGFLLAVCLLRPWQRPAAAPGELQVEKPAATPIARLTLATGAPEMLPPNETLWFGCPTDAPINPGACVRTPANVRCELDTAAGCRLRLDGGAEVRFDDSRQVELMRGQVWSTVKSQDQVIDVEPAGVAICARDAEFCISCQPGEAVLTVVKGAATVRGPRNERTISAGEKAKIVAGVVAENHATLTPLLDTGWVNELVCLKPPDDPELVQRVNDILAQIGEAKLSYLYEEEIRRLGDRAVLPLLRFIASDRSLSDQGRRTIAARIVADLATAEAIDDLIELLADDSPAVRGAAAQALFRLTGRDQGYSLEQWRTADAAMREAGFVAWRQWRSENSRRPRETAPASKSPSSPPPMSKARAGKL
jgi:ferric-dicitrate binding protein FerR (iron transport regulator)